MKDVKQKEHIKSAKVLDDTARIPRNMKALAVKVSEQANNGSEQYDSPTEYAEEKALEYGKSTSTKILNEAESITHRAVDKAKEINAEFRERRELSQLRETDSTVDQSATKSEHTVSDFPSETTQQNLSAYKGGQQYAKEQAEKHLQTAYTNRSSTEYISHGQYGASHENTVQTVKQVPQRTVKNAQNTVKTAQRTVKTSEKTVKTAEKAAKTSAKTAQRASEMAAKAAKATAEAAKAVAKVIAEVIKDIAAGIKELVAAIIAGGWVSVLIIAIIAVVAIIVLSAFGIFWANDTGEDEPMTTIIQSIDSEFRYGIRHTVEEYSESKEYDDVRIVYAGDNDGDSACVNNWNDVLCVYAVMQTTDAENPIEVITVNSNTKAELQAIFLDMNRVKYETEVIEETDENAPSPTPDADGNVPEQPMKSVLVVTVRQNALTYKEAAKKYKFTDEQNEILSELMSPEYYTYLASLAGVDVYNGTDLTEIISNLPANEKGSEVVKVALTQLGAPYVWGAKGSTKFDCSGLAYWSINQVDPTLGSKMYTNAAGQAKYCYKQNKVVGEDELQPGDLVFWVNKNCPGCSRWKEIHHVGIYAGNGKVIEASSGVGRVIIRDLWSSSGYPIYMYGRPY